MVSHPGLRFWFMTAQSNLHLKLNGEPDTGSLEKFTFGQVIVICHPILNMITMYEGGEHSRLLRILPWITQVAIFSIVIIFFADDWIGTSGVLG
jgi:hypothetical protein